MLQIGIYPLHLRMQSSHLPPRLLLDSNRTRAIPFLPAYVPTSATCPRSRCTTRHVSAGPRHRNLRWPGCRRLPRPRHRSPVYTQMMYYHHYYWHTVWVVIQLQIVHGIGGQNVFCAVILLPFLYVTIECLETKLHKNNRYKDPPVTIGLAHLSPFSQRSTIPHLNGSLRSDRSAATHGVDLAAKSHQTMAISATIALLTLNWQNDLTLFSTIIIIRRERPCWHKPAVDHGWESSPLQGPGPQSDGRTVLNDINIVAT